MEQQVTTIHDEKLTALAPHVPPSSSGSHSGRSGTSVQELRVQSQARRHLQRPQRRVAAAAAAAAVEEVAVELVATAAMVGVAAGGACFCYNRYCCSRRLFLVSC